MFSILLQLLLAVPLLVKGHAIQKPFAKQNAGLREYTIYNKCPTAIDLYIAGVKHNTIPKNGHVVKILSTGAGSFYTDANTSPTAQGTIRARFFSEDFYYMVASPNHVNTGLEVKPKGFAPINGFCEPIQCNSRGCPQAFSQAPWSFPAPAPTPPNPPYNRCPYANVPYDITFCPTGAWPNQGQPIHFNFFQNKCLDVQGAIFTDGTPVQIYECNGTPAQQWFIENGSTKVQLAGTNFCLDAGTIPANGVQLKIWTCYDNLPAQQWVYTNDDRIALENKGFCTDLENGITTNGNKVQTWDCSDNNPNQIWTL